MLPYIEKTRLKQTIIMLERLDNLLRAVKQARQRANDLELESTREVAEKIFQYINNGEV